MCYGGSPPPTKEEAEYATRFALPDHIPAWFLNFGMHECMFHTLRPLPSRLRPFLQQGWQVFSMVWRYLAVPTVTCAVQRLAALEDSGRGSVHVPGRQCRPMTRRLRSKPASALT